MATPHVPRCLTIAASDSSGGAGVQADLHAFAAAGCYGASVMVGVTAQNTRGITRVHDVPADVVDAQLTAVLDDIDIDSIKTGALLSESIVFTVAQRLRPLHVPLVVDPVMSASAGGELLSSAAVEAMISMLLPLATVVTPNDHEAAALAGATASRAAMAERIAAHGPQAVLITGGEGAPVDHLYTQGRHVEIAVHRHNLAARHGTGCTHSATLAAELAKGRDVESAARIAAAVTAQAVARGIADLGGGEGPVDVTDLPERLSARKLDPGGAQESGAIQRRRTT